MEKKTKLSICIPTYNRAAFLRFLLTTFVEQKVIDFPYEIVISDNASTDDTATVVEEFLLQGLPIKYCRRDVDGGGWPNLANAYQQAVGEYALYLADDDLLNFQNLRAAIVYLNINPETVACYAPWTMYDAIDQVDLSLFYTIEKNRKFSRRSFSDVFDFMTKRHIFPEIAIYRTSALRSAFVPKDFCFWAFSHLAHLLDVGAVAFLDKPFYRSVVRTAVVRDRAQAGNDEAMTGWDRYRGGLEYFLYLGSKRGQIDLSPAKSTQYEEACKVFTMRRMSVALRMWFERGEYIKAYEIFARMCYGGGSQHPEIQGLRERLPLMVAVQTLAQKVNAASSLKYLILDQVSSVDSLASLLLEVGLNNNITILPAPTEHTPEITSAAAVFTSSAAGRDTFLDNGYRPNMVFCESDMVSSVVT
ncbi:MULTISPECIES: glycosyltransferase family A protein [unclassified Rhizobium]|uniref:glycosyltransferase family 2 protein n=1 Tax=unclassified Rhizobium TaxID=2613769 RepID=UPI00161CE3FC|nr:MULTISPECIES: glycosyltransferase family A protein [unclassified Rhizobium]MBB3542219.1 glycosyltransferase involved in cell wall biosynthesis [Rhizobium sp. BK399]MCS3738078.1 glycosyltransferase involved in cell wall biosynthesis [Rhizobium sp. BK661]MCS4092926.1 glycosyltransferase involved in cell wall biosynthesis [Rhizobium sp. BK176]